MTVRAQSTDSPHNAAAENQHKVHAGDADSLISNPHEEAILSSGEMPSDEDLETYRIVFELFDRDRSGYIDKHDLAAISAKLGKDPAEGKYFVPPPRNLPVLP